LGESVTKYGCRRKESEEHRFDSDVFGLTGIVVAATANSEVAVLAPLGSIGVAHQPVFKGLTL